MIVIDASLATKLIIREAETDAARHWFRTTEQPVVAPDLIAIEVAQAIVRRVNMRQSTSDAGRAALRAWRMTLDDNAVELTRSTSADVDAAAHIAIRLGHPVKDCLYLALAIDLGCDLATCDAKFRDKAVGLYPNIRLLAAFT